MKHTTLLFAFFFFFAASKAQTAVISNDQPMYIGIENKLIIKTKNIDTKSLTVRTDHGIIEKQNGEFIFKSESAEPSTITVSMIKGGKYVVLAEKYFKVQLLSPPVKSNTKSLSLL